MTLDLQTTIEKAWEDRTNLSPADASAEVREAVEHTIDGLDLGRLRVAEKINDDWVVHQWIKKAVLLSFRLSENAIMGQAPLQFYDKVPLKFSEYGDNAFKQGGYRVVPPAVARRGAYIARNVVLMPSYVNIGAYVDEGTMVDTWATVGSCAQIGKNVHLSGGVGIGGVLEPLQANPPSSRTTASSAPVPKWWKAWWSKRTRCWPWACSCRKAPRSMTAPPARSPTAACRRARWWCRARCFGRRFAQPGLRRDRQARRRADARQTSINDLLRA